MNVNFGFYSFIVLADDELPLPEYLIYLEPGRNVFNALLKTDLDTFTNFLMEHGVKVVQANRLDVHEKVDPSDYPDWDALDAAPAPPLLSR